MIESLRKKSPGIALVFGFLLSTAALADETLDQKDQNKSSQAPLKTAKSSEASTDTHAAQPEASSADSEAAAAQKRTDRARNLGLQALAEYARGEISLALKHFIEAESLVHSPVFVLHIGRCQRALGNANAARNALEKVSAEPLGPGAPQPWTDAQAAARRELETLKQEQAQKSGTAEATSTTADESEPKEDKASKSATPSNEPESSLYTRKSNPRLIWGWSLTGLGGTALLAGAGTGIAALLLSNSVKSNCIANSCPAEEEARRDRALRLGNATTGLLIAGGVLSASGLTLLLWPQKSGREVSLTLEPNYAGLSGKF